MILFLPFPPIFCSWTQTWLREFAYRLHVYDHWFSKMIFFAWHLLLLLCILCIFCVELSRRTDNYEKSQIIDLSRKIHSLYTFMYMFPVSVSSWCLVAWRTRHIQVNFSSVFLYTMTIIFSLKKAERNDRKEKNKQETRVSLISS